jgi:hypothetical protein
MRCVVAATLHGVPLSCWFSSRTPLQSRMVDGAEVGASTAWSFRQRAVWSTMPLIDNGEQ